VADAARDAGGIIPDMNQMTSMQGQTPPWLRLLPPPCAGVAVRPGGRPLSREIRTAPGSAPHVPRPNA